MDRFRQLETLIAVAETGGFHAAGRRLGLSAPSVTRLIAALEARTGTRLFTRTTRQVALTEAGRRLVADAARILGDLAEAEASAAGAHEAPQGVLSITAPVKFGHLHVAPVLRAYLDAHPAVRARTLFVDRVVNLIEEGLDVALRIGQLPDSTLTATRIGHVRRVVVAAPAYLARHGAPERPADLARHRTALATGLSPDARWRFERGGRAEVIQLSPTLRCNTVDAALDAALAGWAVTRLHSYQAAAALADGRLVELLPGADDRQIPVHLLHAEGPLRAAKIRSFIDFAATRLRREASGWAG